MTKILTKKYAFLNSQTKYMKKISKIITILIVVFNTNSLFAQQDSLSIKSLDEVIVTGQYKPQSLKNKIGVGNRWGINSYSKVNDIAPKGQRGWGNQ